MNRSIASPNGLDFVKTLDDPPHVILTTAYRDYAVEGFELDVVDYLLKPIALPRFLKAMDKYYALARREGAPVTDRPATERVLNVRADRRVVKVPLGTILFIESMGD